MKKIIFTLALLVQVGFAMADNKLKVVVQARHENVKMFQQPGTSAEILETLTTSEKVAFVRKHNAQWAIVSANGKTGYVLLTELANLKDTRTAAR